MHIPKEYFPPKNKITSKSFLEKKIHFNLLSNFDLQYWDLVFSPSVPNVFEFQILMTSGGQNEMKKIKIVGLLLF